MKDKTCKCTHLKSEHKSSLCNNCPCTTFNRTDAKPIINKIFMVFGLAGTLLFAIGLPIMFIIDTMNTPEELMDQIIITHNGIEATTQSMTYLELVIGVNALGIMTSLLLSLVYLYIFTDSRKILRRKDYNV